MGDQRTAADDLGIGGAVTAPDQTTALLNSALADLASNDAWSLTDVAQSLQQLQIDPAVAWQYWGEQLSADPVANAKLARKLQIDLVG
jgi:hypothetical protein